MALINMRMTVVLTALFAFVASPALGSSILELGAPDQNEGDSVVSLGNAPEKKTKAIDLGSLRFTKGELPAGRLTLKQRMRKRLQLARSRNESLSRSNRERLRRVRGGDDADRALEGEDIASYRERRRGGEEEERGESDEEEIFRDIEDQIASAEGDTEPRDAPAGFVPEGDVGDIPIRNDPDPGDPRIAEAPEGDAGVRGGTTSAGKSIELKQEARDPNGDLYLGADS